MSELDPATVITIADAALHDPMGPRDGGAAPSFPVTSVLFGERAAAGGGGLGGERHSPDEEAVGAEQSRRIHG